MRYHLPCVRLRYLRAALYLNALRGDNCDDFQ